MIFEPYWIGVWGAFSLNIWDIYSGESITLREDSVLSSLWYGEAKGRQLGESMAHRWFKMIGNNY